tara:strand:+ start:352 stop:939 length:588 start_codon:yes stop_codon:yes gene_type:complete
MSNIQNYDIKIDLLKHIPWQYDNAEHLKKIIQNKQDNFQKYVIDFINDFYTNVYNVDTANDFGLRIWEIILNIDFTIPELPPRTNNIFGFGDFNSNFYNSNFLPVAGEDNSLSVELKRLVVKLKYQSYFAPSSIIEINRVVKIILSDTSYAIDNLNMSVTINIDSSNVDPERFNIMKDYYLLSIPAAVSINYIWF